MQKKTNIKRFLSLALCIVLITAVALCFAACDKTETPKLTGGDVSTSASEEKTFTFTVTHKDGSTKSFEITSDKSTVGEALIESGLINGEEGPYGLYVKTVDGETLDYDTDKMYWAFYEGESYAATGVDLTEIKDGAIYSFKAEK